MTFTRWAVAVALAMLISTPASAAWHSFLGGLAGDGATSTSTDDTTGGGAGENDSGASEEDPPEIDPSILDTTANLPGPGADDLFEPPPQLPVTQTEGSSQVAQVPEPASLALLALGLVGLGWRRIRQQ